VKETKPEEMDDRESERLHSTEELGEPVPRDPKEGREPHGMELLEGKMEGIPGPETVSTKLQKIAELAGKAPEMAFTSLNHHINIDWLLEAYRRTRKDKAPGIDGQTAKEYEKNLLENLNHLLERFKSGRYKAPPVKRVYIPKGDGSKTRPIGIPTFEDKILQRAVTMVLEAIFEKDFLDCSYGYRPGRSAHQAVQKLWDQLMEMGGGFVLELDIQKFFDTLDHSLLRSFLDQRVRDGVIRRTIDKWLKAGVMEEGALWRLEIGTPQGGVVSPILANLYLHEVLDLWFHRDVLPRLKDTAVLIRFADDAVLVFASESDAKRVMEVLPKRFGKYGLTLHPQKTKLVDFKRPNNSGSSSPGSFDLLGFTHFWGKSRKGRWVVKRRTAKDRFARTLKKVAEWCKKERHLPVREQYRTLCRKLVGHNQYYGITGNYYALARFYRSVRMVWRKWLDRRSQKAKMSWDRYNQLLVTYRLPKPRVVHSVYDAVKP
jgi:group II intron reverse transcriptase/maturase